VALVAVGGYGRRELCPYSDLDVILVHRGRRHIKELAEQVWYPVWDAGIRLDHSVRTVKEALSVASDDLKAALGLLDARFVAGDESLADELAVRAREQWRGRGSRSLGALRAQVEERHQAHGEVAFLLEPELKEGKGGLRDVVALRAAASWPLPEAVLDAEAVLLAARVELHRRTGKATDRLLLQEQDAVATALHYADADQLMGAVADAARVIAWESDDRWRRVSSQLAGPSGRVAASDRPLGAGLVARDGEIVLAADADVAGDPSLPWRAASSWATTGTPMARPTLEQLGAESPAPPERWPPAMVSALLTILGAGHAAIPVIEALDQMGLLVRALPEWAAVRNRPQRNAYHRFTVDRHLCETAANAAAFTRDVARPDLLLLGAWLHDIGKGWPGRDHTEVGIERIATIAGGRLGLEADDVAVLQALVRHHLLLPDVATRRDLDDPATIELVATAVGDGMTLDLLAALTEADSLATGPAAWGQWKAGLVSELAERTRRALAGGDLPQGPTLDVAAYAARLRPGTPVAVDVDGSQLTVVARDRPGLLSRVAGTLALHGLDVRSAQVASNDEGVAVELLIVEPAFGQEPDWDALADDVGKALSGRLSLESRLADRARAYASRQRPAAARPAEARVLFDNEASASATVVEVRAPDAMGVLYRITRALADCDLDVRSAKVSTLGHEVVDAFYVRDADGQKLTDADHLREVARAVLAELGRR
jgi:[protein-PII] uridylyltransferase